ncbi:PKD domain-containing protein [Marivirga tractuosa]|uniref:PKD domain-containing protein n=1 Tax=Marivirga tractuosa TaxID=1006 RepID=UPI0035CEE508
MENLFRKFMIIAALFIFASCEEDPENELVDPPTEEDAAFTFEATAESDNILEFTASVDGFNRYAWDLGNGEDAPENQSVTGTYPNAGTYEVTLTVFNDGGSASSTQEIEIEETDPTLLDNELYNILTGGIENGGSKTWAVDSASAGHFGVGPSPENGDYSGDFPEYYAAQAVEKTGAGMYDDRYTFTLEGFGFDMVTNGDIYVNAEHQDDFPGAEETEVADFIAPFTPSEDLSWSLAAPDDGDTTLTISSDGFIGYWTGTRSYKVVTIEENELFIQMEDTENPDLVWYIRLVPEGFDSSDGENPGDDDGGGDEEAPNIEFNGGEGLTAELLTGEAAKSWKLKESAGAFGVGDAAGSDNFFPNGDNISGDRPCLFNDLFIFNQDGTYEYDAQGDFFGEAYYGFDEYTEDDCYDISVLDGTPAEVWSSATHEFTFSAFEDADNPAQITVTGTGAFIALPKAYNGGEYDAAPTESSSVTYDVYSYNAETQELFITIDVGGAFWNFLLVPAE